MRANRLSAVIEHYETALRLKPDYETARANLAGLRTRLNPSGNVK